MRRSKGTAPTMSCRLADIHQHEIEVISKKFLSYDDDSQAFRYLTRSIDFVIRQMVSHLPPSPPPKQFKSLQRLKGENEREISFRLDGEYRKIIASLSKILGYERESYTVRFIIHYGYLYVKSLVEKNMNLVLEYTISGKGRISFLDKALDDQTTMTGYVDEFIRVLGAEKVSAIQSNYSFRKAEETKDLEVLKRTREHLVKHKGPGPYGRDEILAAIRLVGHYGYKKSEQVLRLALEQGLLEDPEGFANYLFREEGEHG